MNLSSDERTVAGYPGRPSMDITLSSGRQFVQSLPFDSVRVGRSRECDIVLEDKGISRQHAQIESVDGQWVIRDLQSANGVFVNGKRVQEIALSSGDTVKLGGCSITFTLPEKEKNLDHTDRTVIKKNVFPKERSSKPQSGQEKRKDSSGNKKWVTLALGVVGFLVLVLLALSFLSESETVPDHAETTDQEVESAIHFPSAIPDLHTETGDEVSILDRPADSITGVPSPDATDEYKVLAAQYAELAQIYYDSGKYPDAVREWSYSLSLDQSNEAVRIKLESAREELLARADQAFRLGLRNYQFLNYHEAISNWNYVLFMIPDPEHPLHQNALRNIQQAESQLKK